MEERKQRLIMLTYIEYLRLKDVISDFYQNSSRELCPIISKSKVDKDQYLMVMSYVPDTSFFAELINNGFDFTYEEGSLIIRSQQFQIKSRVDPFYRHYQVA